MDIFDCDLAVEISWFVCFGIGLLLVFGAGMIPFKHGEEDDVAQL